MYVMFYHRVKGSFGWTKPNNGIYITQHNQQTCAWRATLESCDTRTIKGRINLFIELDVKLDQIAARNIRISLDKRTATALQRKTYEGKYTRDKILPTVLPNSSNHSRARRHNKECKYWSNTGFHSKRHFNFFFLSSPWGSVYRFLHSILRHLIKAKCS